jgi:molybdopterin molybdotransferase
LENGSARRHYVRVHVERQADGGYGARLVGNQGAGVLTSMVESDGLVELGEDVTHLKAGETVDFLPFSEVDA